MATRGHTLIRSIPLSHLNAGSGGNAIVFLHGSGMSAANWLPQLTDVSLIERYNLYALDLPGHGQSGRAENTKLYRPNGMAGLLAEFLTANQIHRYILVGLSFGTNVIGELAKPLPGCCGLVLVSPCILNHTTALPSTVITAGAHGHVIATPNPSLDDLRAYVYDHTNNTILAEQYIKDYLATDPAFRGEMAATMMDGGWTDELENVSAWDVPVCIIFGKDDSLLKTGYLDAFEPRWNNQVYKITAAGHLVNEEQPEAFNRILWEYAEERFR